MKARVQDLSRLQIARQRRWLLHGSVGIALSMALVGAGLFALKSSAQRSDPPAVADQDALSPQRGVDQWKPAIATVFWVGEEAAPDNGFIHNKASAWDVNWQKSFGGIDDPKDRCGYRPCAFKPLENAFYVALPYNDITDAGIRKEDTSFIPWDVRDS